MNDCQMMEGLDILYERASRALLSVEEPGGPGTSYPPAPTRTLHLYSQGAFHRTGAPL